MGQIKFTVPDEVEEAFRKAAMEQFGYERGSLTKAGEAALREWAESVERMGQFRIPDAPVSAVRGQLARVDAGSVELQESVGELRAKDHLHGRRGEQ